jgi:hypothetical protein
MVLSVSCTDVCSTDGTRENPEREKTKMMKKALIFCVLLNMVWIDSIITDKNLPDSHPRESGDPENKFLDSRSQSGMTYNIVSTIYNDL